MKRWLGVCVLLTCATSGCDVFARPQATATPTPTLSPSPTVKPVAEPTGTPGAASTPAATPALKPFTLYSQEQIGQGEYELVNNLTEQFVSVTPGGVRKMCSRGVHAGCTNAAILAATMYSGNTQVTVSPRQFALRSRAGLRYSTAPVRQAQQVVQPNALLPRTVLRPDDDGDYVSGSLVFLLPARPGKFSLVWQGHHVATFVTTARGKLYETR